MLSGTARLVRTHVIAAGMHKGSCPLRAHLDPRGLDVGQRLLQRQPRHRMHQEAFMQRGPLPGPPCKEDHLQLASQPVKSASCQEGAHSGLEEECGAGLVSHLPTVLVAKR